jgi:hypothetical protein
MSTIQFGLSPSFSKIPRFVKNWEALGERACRARAWASWSAARGLMAEGEATPGGRGCRVGAAVAAASAPLTATNHANRSAYYERHEAACIFPAKRVRHRVTKTRSGLRCTVHFLDQHAEGQRVGI